MGACILKEFETFTATFSKNSMSKMCSGAKGMVNCVNSDYTCRQAMAELDPEFESNLAKFMVFVHRCQNSRLPI